MFTSIKKVLNDWRFFPILTYMILLLAFILTGFMIWLQILELLYFSIFLILLSFFFGIITFLLFVLGKLDKD